jgi:PAS domain S-box-containing protein
MTSAPANGGQGTVLVVDDNPNNLRLLSAMLIEHGFAVRVVTSGYMALKSVEVDTPDIVLLDINMPHLNGYEVCRRLKEQEQTRDLPVIFISALGDVSDKVRGFAVGGVDYITKPFQVEEVLARVTTHLMLRRTQHELHKQNVRLQQEIVERKQLEYALRKSEERFRLLADNAQDILFRYNFTEPRGFEYISPAVATIMGFTPEEYYADPDLDLKRLHRESLPQFTVRFQTPDSYNEPIVMRYIRKDGSSVWIEQNHWMVRDESGRPVAIEGISRDVTERKRAEQELKQALRDVTILNNRFQSELNLAHNIQQELLPPPCPGWEWVDVLCYNRPAREVGGDLYAYAAFPAEGAGADDDVSYVLAIGDVSGKGMSASLLMAVSMALFRSLMDRGPGGADTLQYLDCALSDYTRTTGQNCAFIYGELWLPGGDRWEQGPSADAPYALLRVVNAGCVYPLIRRANGQTQWIDVTGLPLGVGLDIKGPYEQVSVALEPGDVVVLMSDGVVESRNVAGEVFGFQRLEDTVRQSTADRAEDVVRALLAALALFTGDGEPHDDVTIVVARV